MVNDIVKLDVHRDNGYQSIKSKQYDTNSRTITIELFDNGIPRNIENNEIPRMRFTKPDGKWGIFDADSKSNNSAIFTMIPQMLNVPGEVKIDVGIYQDAGTGTPEDDKLISTYLFYNQVSPSAYSEDAVMSSNEALTLKKLIREQKILKEQTIALNNRSQELISQMEQLLGM
ncbi:phage baseplate upper protein [Anaerocolumna aminovalerica]|uniref:BppU family phage baseplate upper protein n=1 Tax=Anaerocolumna aminovalerica TaxID=1527 RepID=UPI001C0EE0DC|nr:BppU family phage baseplate upper protein [Anaerocolumna aminovalerica]MBU5332126.1 phage baseplate upper protein [Anaerocolumna aminovalerica]